MKNDPNLFEAFKDASARGAAESGPGGGDAPRPFGGSRPGGASAGAFGRAPGGAVAGLEPRALALVGILMVASFLAGWALRGPGDAVRAQTPGAGQGGQGVPAVGGGLAPPPTVDDRDPRVLPEDTSGTAPGPSGTSGAQVSAGTGLYNPANKTTVLAITYRDLPSLESLALSTAQHLRDAGLPAFDPIVHGGNIEVLVGAAPTKSELQPVLTKLRRTRGPGGNDFPFADAMYVTIDTRVVR